MPQLNLKQQSEQDMSCCQLSATAAWNAYPESSERDDHLHNFMEMIRVEINK